MKTIEHIVKEIKMLNDEISYKLMDYHLRYTIWDNGVIMNEDDFGPAGLILPYVPVKRVRFFMGTRETGSYNHGVQLAKFKDKYYFGWGNASRDEFQPGMRVLVSSSPDAWSWTEPAIIIGGEKGTTKAFECVGMRATQDELYVLANSNEIIYDKKSPGGRYHVDWDKKRLEVYSTKNGSEWEHVYTYDSKIQKLLEAPRETQDREMLCVCSMQDNTVAVLRWKDANLLKEPDIVPIAFPEGASFGNGEGSWYQTKDGRIITLWREDGLSCRLWVSYSDDDGKTFTELARSDIPDSSARIYAGTLADGRHYLVNNAFPTISTRRHLILFLSDNGLVFNKAYVIVNDITTHRFRGAMKNIGYQYPCCLPEKDRLIIGYSVNKEDMECAVIDINNI